MDFEQVLDECRSNIGRAPRKVSFWKYHTYLFTQGPKWAATDPLLYYFQNQKLLLEQGTVVWGHIVQANTLMYKAGPLNCPGDIVYCADPKLVVDVRQLSDVARQLFKLKGEAKSDSQESWISEYLANERKRVFGLPVPSTISPSMPCAISTVFFNRKHLPTGVLTKSLMPLLVMEQEPQIAMVLPSDYWPESMHRHWNS